jgi:DNA-binding response OmpR family regulator
MKDGHMKVLIIEDEAGIIDAVRLAFEFRWPEAVVIDATTGKEGIEKVRTELPDVAILDINLPDMSGFEVLKEIQFFLCPVDHSKCTFGRHRYFKRA